MAQTMTRPVTVDLPDSLVQELETKARRERRSISEMVRDLVLQSWHATPILPEDVETELAAFTNLSDDALWILARSTLTQAEQEKLAHLNYEAKRRSLTEEEEAQRQALLDTFDRTMVRRAQAALLLKSRGYDLTDPDILQAS